MTAATQFQEMLARLGRAAPTSDRASAHAHS
jgi:hypothetical protein